MRRNKALSDHFKEISDRYARINEKQHKDHWPSVTFDRSAAAIRRVRRPIRTVDDLEGIAGIGKVSRQIARQFLETGTSNYMIELRRGGRPHGSGNEIDLPKRPRSRSRGSGKKASRKRKPTSRGSRKGGGRASRASTSRQNSRKRSRS